jgi:N-methylhydantoinase B
VGLGAVLNLIETHGLERFRAAVEMVLDYGESKMRATISEFPDGRYTATVVHEHNGIEEVMLPYVVAVEIDGDEVTVDVTDAPPPQPGPVNAPYSGLVSAVRCAMMALIGGDGRANEGYFRPITIKTKPNTLFDAQKPAPCGLSSWPLYPLIDGIHHAFAEADPDRLPAGYDMPICLIFWGADAEGRFWADCAVAIGGQPASPRYGDGGAPLMPITCSGVRQPSWEMWESKTPMIVERVESVIDTSGAAKYRGGSAVDLVFTMLRDADVTGINERAQVPPHGLFGGASGEATCISFARPDGTVESHAKVTAAHLPAGTVVTARLSSGGGYGLSSERSADAVHADIAEGLLSEERARRDYPHAFVA